MDLEIKFGKIIFDSNLTDSYLSKIYNNNTYGNNDSSDESSFDGLDDFSIHNLCCVSNKKKYFDDESKTNKLFAYNKMNINSSFFTNINKAYDIIILLTNFGDGEIIHNYNAVLLYVSGKIIKLFKDIRIEAKSLYKKQQNKKTLRYLKYAEWLLFWAKLSRDTFGNKAFISISLID